jgi:uncharacterized protein (DUF342 family)
MEAITAITGEVLKTGRASQRSQIAAGRSPVGGKDGSIVPVPGQLLLQRGGRRAKEWMTRKGEVLARIVPASPGTSGINVLGEEIPAPCGKVAALSMLAGVVFDAITATFVATVDGLATFDGQSLEVRRHLVWPGDLTVNDKAIEFEGTVVIKGTVKDGARVVATEDIEVEAGVEGATVVSSGGAVRVKQGLAGRGCGFISAKTVVDVRYVENATVYCEGDILVRHAVLHSRLTAGKQVAVDMGKGVVFGGDLRAGSCIQVKCLGNAAGVATRVSVGHDWKILQQLGEHEQQAAGLRQMIVALEKVIEQFRHARPDLLKLSSVERQALCAVVKRHIVLSAQAREQEQRYRDLDASWTLEGGGEILCRETLFSGTSIKMGSGTTLVSQTQSACTVQFHREQKRIVATTPAGRRVELT